MHQPFLIKAEKHHYQRIKCSLSDLFVARAPVSVVFFYQVIISEEKLIQALKKVLTDFPIFAGILIKKNHQLYIDCNNQGVQVRIEHLTVPLSMTPELTTLSADNLVDIISARQALKYQKPLFTIRLRYHPNGMTIGYSFQPTSIQDFLQKFHELKKLNRVLPEDLTPKYKNLIISNWCNFGVYAVDFGIEAPYLFLPVGKAPFPWLSCIVEGPNNEGLLMSIVLPRAVASRLSKISSPFESIAPSSTPSSLGYNLSS